MNRLPAQVSPIGGHDATAGVTLLTPPVRYLDRPPVQSTPPAGDAPSPEEGKIGTRCHSEKSRDEDRDKTIPQ